MKIIKLTSVDSTNTYALKHFEELEDLCAVSADFQTAGRGRFQRRWHSENPENLYVSLVLKPQKKTYLANLTQYMSVVCSKVIESYGVKSQIKWANDVLVEGKKISGILCEAYLKKNQIQGVVLGIGVNLNMSKESLQDISQPATSLNLASGRNVSKEEFLERLVQEFLCGYHSAVEDGFEAFRADYLKRINFSGKEVFIRKRDGEEKEPFTALRIDSAGNLIVLGRDGKEKTILSGDLIL